MKKRSKNYLVLKNLVDKNKYYSIEEAVKKMLETKSKKFVESIDLAIKLGVDPKKNLVRGTVVLPAGSGKTKKVAVLTKPDKAKEAQDAGADVVGDEDLVEKIKGGFLGFDILIATPDMMASVGKLGKILGTKGLMPNPKSGTVTMELAKTVKEFKSGKVEFRMDKGGALHMVIGKTSFSEADICKNLQAALDAIRTHKPSGLKGAYLESITISSTMGPGVRLNAKEISEKLDKE
jgi:large subunit ribosomal protein L1